MPGVGRTSITLSAAGGRGRAGRAGASLRQLLGIGDDLGPPKRSLICSQPWLWGWCRLSTRGSHLCSQMSGFPGSSGRVLAKGEALCPAGLSLPVWLWEPEGSWWNWVDALCPRSSAPPCLWARKQTRGPELRQQAHRPPRPSSFLSKCFPPCKESQLRR